MLHFSDRVLSGNGRPEASAAWRVPACVPEFTPRLNDLWPKIQDFQDGFRLPLVRETKAEFIDRLCKQLKAQAGAYYDALLAERPPVIPNPIMVRNHRWLAMHQADMSLREVQDHDVDGRKVCESTISRGIDDAVAELQTYRREGKRGPKKTTKTA